MNLPPSFGSAYVGETFSCTLCANHDIPDDPPRPAPAYPSGGRNPTAAGSGATAAAIAGGGKKTIRDVRIDAEMKTPASATATKLELGPDGGPESAGDPDGGVDLEAGQTLQKVVNFDLKEEGHHVLAVTVSYYEATETSGRTRTFRKLYQFICKASLIVRTKPGPLPAGKDGGRRWVLEAQLENCSEDVIQLERVALEAEAGLSYDDCNWGASGSQKPALHPGEVEQVCFVVQEAVVDGVGGATSQEGGRVIFGSLGVGWRGEMGNRGFLSTGKLGWGGPGKTKVSEPRA